MCPFLPFLFMFHWRQKVTEKKVVTEIIASNTQNLRKSMYKSVMHNDQTGNCLQDSVKTVKLYHEPVISQQGNIIKKEQFHNKKKTQR